MIVFRETSRIIFHDKSFSSCIASTPQCFLTNHSLSCETTAAWRYSSSTIAFLVSSLLFSLRCVSLSPLLFSTHTAFENAALVFSSHTLCTRNAFPRVSILCQACVRSTRAKSHSLAHRDSPSVGNQPVRAWDMGSVV